MEEQIDELREELNDLAAKDICLHGDGVVKISQELDNLICAYYEDMEPV